jgi:hypothetical protein
MQPSAGEKHHNTPATRPEAEETRLLRSQRRRGQSFLGLICEQPVFPGDPGIVKCVVEPSEGFESEWYDPLHLLGLAEVCLDERRRSAVAFDVIDEQSPLALPPSCDDYLST